MNFKIFFFSLLIVDAPVCRENDLKKNYEARLGEMVEIKCLVDAASKTNLTFTWSAKSDSTHENRKLLTNYTSHSDTSYLYYRPTKVYDFGFIYCSAKNIVGHQLEPCIFTIKPVRGKFKINLFPSFMREQKKFHFDS